MTTSKIYGANAVNDANTAVGGATKYVDGSELGARAGRRENRSTVATELGTIGTRNDGKTDSFAYAVNNTNTTVGWAEKNPML